MPLWKWGPWVLLATECGGAAARVGAWGLLLLRAAQRPAALLVGPCEPLPSLPLPPLRPM